MNFSRLHSSNNSTKSNDTLKSIKDETLDDPFEEPKPQPDPIVPDDPFEEEPKPVPFEEETAVVQEDIFGIDDLNAIRSFSRPKEGRDFGLF